MICSSCGTVGNGATTVQGSFLIEVVLWLFMILPGLIYSIWRLTTKKVGCASCGGAALIPLNSPRGQQLQRELGIQPGR
jgi:hypothetical protein